MFQDPKQAKSLVNLDRLARFFEDGAPQFEFDMSRGLMIDAILDRVMPGHCGSAGCIAGAAFIMYLADMPEAERLEYMKELTPSKLDVDQIADTEVDYGHVANGAMAFLGLKEDKDTDWAKHPLFDMRAAPQPCKPHHAAAAIRRVMAGEAPWT